MLGLPGPGGPPSMDTGFPNPGFSTPGGFDTTAGPSFDATRGSSLSETGFPGETNSPNFNPSTGGGIDSFLSSLANAQVSTIQEDAFGYYYVFSTSSSDTGIRVNITKDGYCSKVRVHETTLCMHMCYSDEQCPGSQKCCPSRCSLDCVVPMTPPPMETNGASDQAMTMTAQSHTDSAALGGKFFFPF